MSEGDREEVPVEEVPIEEVPIDEVPVEQVPIEEVPVEEVPIEEVPIEEVPILAERSGLDRYLEDTGVVDWQTPVVYDKARKLLGPGASTEDRIRAAYEFVRDDIQDCLAEGHASEAVPCTASQVLREGAGLSYARCHLLAALLRAQGIPTGFGYQRLVDPGCPSGYALHGWAAAWLADEERWLPLDPAGRSEGGALAFRLDPPHFAHRPDPEAGEMHFPTLYARPARTVVDLLEKAETLARIRPYLPNALP